MPCLSCEERRAIIVAALRKMLHLPVDARDKAIAQAKKDVKLYNALAASWVAEHPRYADQP